MLAVRRDRPFDASAKVRRWMASRRALVIGIAGQDGSLLAELLLAEGYEVFGVVRQPISTQFPNLVEIRDELELSQADVLDELSLVDVLTASRPDEVYNLAAPSFVPMSWRQPVLTAEFAAVGCTALLEAIRRVDSDIRFYQASSSEIFGEPREVPQHEQTPLAPVTPYGVAKAYAHFITRSYRRRYGLHASSGILYNHESPRRPLDFVTRKVSHAAAAINLGIERDVSLGDLDARRDWGYAGDYVRAMWLMLQQPEPDDYVIASGESHSVRELVDRAFSRAGLDWEEHVRIDDSLVRGKAELHDLVGDPSRARERLGWSPTVDFDELVNLLVDSDLERLRAELEQTGVAVE
jgi:GDPmannose 4,6-dehydratase